MWWLWLRVADTGARLLESRVYTWSGVRILVENTLVRSELLSSRNELEIRFESHTNRHLYLSVHIAENANGTKMKHLTVARGPYPHAHTHRCTAESKTFFFEMVFSKIHPE